MNENLRYVGQLYNQAIHGDGSAVAELSKIAMGRPEPKIRHIVQRMDAVIASKKAKANKSTT